MLLPICFEQEFNKWQLLHCVTILLLCKKNKTAITVITIKIIKPLNLLTWLKPYYIVEFHGLWSLNLLFDL